MTHHTPERPPYADDLHRPRVHFLPPAGWMNDPNGVIQVNGQYHLFYQYNPHAAVWHQIHWGHAVSDDLLHWRDQPPALAPDTPGLDDAGCWSGCAVEAGGEILLVYTAATGEVAPDGISTGYRNQAIAGALGRGDGSPWRKLPELLVPRLPNDGDIWGVRDPVIWREAADGAPVWKMSIGGGLRGKGGAALLYSSDDLRHWRPEGLLHHDALGEVWECPQLLTFDDGRAALLVNVWAPPERSYTAYYSGTYRDGRFTPHFLERFELHDSALFAPQATRDEQGRWLLWGWLLEERSIEARIRAGWSGVMSLPRVVTMDADGRLRQNVAPELTALRETGGPLALNAEQSGEARDIDNPAVVTRLDGQTLDLEVVFEVGADDQAELILRWLPEGWESLSIVYDRPHSVLWIDRGQSSLNSQDGVALGQLHAGLALAPGAPLRLRVIVDHSVVEVFVDDGRACAALRMYPTVGEGLEVSWTGTANVRLREAAAWRLRGIS